MHGWYHMWFNPRTKMLYSDEATEQGPPVAKRYALVNSTRQDVTISEGVKHELPKVSIEEA